LDRNLEMDYQLTLNEDPEMSDLMSAWRRISGKLKEGMVPTQYSQFIERLTIKGIEDGCIKIIAPGQFVAGWLNKTLLEQFSTAFSDALGRDLSVEIVAQLSQRGSGGAATVGLPEQSSPTAALPENRFSHRFTFDNFVVGQSNRLAYAGAFAVAEKPGSKYNPLFIYGDSGLGKTHLLQAVANEVRRSGAAATISYVTAQEFAERFVAALQHGRMESFRKSIRQADVWLLDDVQFIAGKDKTQEELFHSFNQLQHAGKQIVLTSDRPPRDLYGLEDRLRSRFEGGLVADIMPPDTETRTAIVMQKAEVEGVPLSMEVCECIAMSVAGNVRALEGALTKILAHASFERSEVTVDLVQKIVETAYPPTAKQKPHFDRILEAVSTEFDVPRRELVGPSRKAEIAHARHICVYLARKITGDSWKRLGERFGNRDHTSMIHAFQKISLLNTNDLEVQSHIRNLERRLLGSDAG
jgi:chromosomal replication initiator protein